MEVLQWQVLPSKMYDSLLNTAANIGTTMASKPIGQLLLDCTEKCLWTVEKSVQWCMLPGQKPEYDGKGSSNEVKEADVATSSENPKDDLGEPESEVVRPLPWVLFLPLLVCLKAAKTSIDVCSYLLHRDCLETSSIVQFIQTRRNLLKEIKDHVKSNQGENKIKDEISGNLNSSSSDKPEKQEIEKVQATPEKESSMESKTETEATAVPSSEAAPSLEAAPSSEAAPSLEAAPSSETAPSLEAVPLSEAAPPSEVVSISTNSDTSAIESIESDNGNDSSSTLEASLTEKEDTKEEDEDFHSVKSSSTYFSPDSSYSHQSVSEESKAGDNLATELERETQDTPSLAAAIEDLRTLPVSEEAPLTTPTSSLSSSTSSVKQTDGSRKRTSFSTFFQVRRRMT